MPSTIPTITGLPPAQAAGHPPARPCPDTPNAHAEFVAALASRPPRPIARDPDPQDFTDRAICCEALLERVKLHLSELIEDAAENDPGRFIADAELPATIDAHLADLRSDIAGAL